MLGTLVRGRVCIAAAAASAPGAVCPSRCATASTRRQFPAAGRPDGVLLLDYLTHQRRLLPKVARAYALGFAQNDLTAALVHVQGDGEYTERDQRELETRAAGLKAMTTWFANDAVQEAREACGGAGYMSENQLDELAPRHRHLRHLRGRQHGAHAARGQGPAHQLRAGSGANSIAPACSQATGRFVGETVMERTCRQPRVRAARRLRAHADPKRPRWWTAAGTR